ncbi:probable E3 ubiquitin-protein ligase ARI8 [Parambassis ranga]|uniref:Probable E3 ubiquitin-protein ligase ARI8 n=1 Tax=Parambassis ranga TaxID=210632 RepID=A0A6P7K867_9TELE|nr:probable E3 ubiquitin-protein ligase ARI8 [Parambassis ranga]
MASNVFNKQKCYDPQDSTLTFTVEKDHLDFLCEGFPSRRARMSCGHAVTPMSLTKWCLMLLNQGKSRFVCGHPGCNTVWPFVEVCKMALLTPPEVNRIKKNLAFNSYKENLNIQTCPGCMSSVVREDGSNLRVRCKTCMTKRGCTFEFCWQCLKEWKGPWRHRSDHCDNEGCHNPALRTLAACPEMTFDSMRVRCPSVRACPTCGALLEHSKKMCKHIICPRCDVSFCFICLKPNYTCSQLCCVAPRQTTLPVWNETL